MSLVNSSVNASTAKRNRVIALVVGAVVLVAAVVLAVVLLSGRSTDADEDLDASAGISDGASVVAPDGTGEDNGGTGDDDDGLGDDTGGTADTGTLITLADVIVTGPVGQAPHVDFPAPFVVEEEQAEILEDGDGQLLEDGMEITFHALVFNGDGELLFDTWEWGAEERFVLDESQASFQNDGGLETALLGAHVGARAAVLMTDPSVAGPSGTILMVLDVIDARVVPTRAWGQPVEDLPEGLPVVTLAEDGEPSIEIPEGFEAPEDLVVQVLIQGDGPLVAQSDALVVQYTGWLVDGTVFDSSWGRGVASFPLQHVIAGWTQGLAGQQVGSQVLLIIPPALGYGDQAAGLIPPGSDLIFVVDILDATGW